MTSATSESAGTRYEVARGDVTLVGDIGGPEDGPTVVLLHGGGQTRHSWSGTWRALCDAEWRAVSMDLRGHGESSWAPDADYSLEAFADDIRAVAASLSAPPVLVGASLGGISSMVAITDAPGDGRDRGEPLAGIDDQARVARALVLVDVANQMEEAGRDRIGAFMTDHLDGFADLEEAADVVAAYNPHRPRPKDPSGLAKNLRQLDDGRWVWHWDPAFVSGKFGSPDETRSSVADEGRLDRAADAMKIPALLVRGRSSDLLSERGAQDFLRRVPHAEFADVTGAGHMVAGDRNEVFNSAMLDFLDRHR